MLGMAHRTCSNPISCGGNPIHRPGLVALQFCAFEFAAGETPSTLADTLKLPPRQAMKRLAQGKIINSQTQKIEAKFSFQRADLETQQQSLFSGKAICSHVSPTGLQISPFIGQLMSDPRVSNTGHLIFRP